MLYELIKSKENVKLKYLALKLAEAETQAKLIKTLKSVTHPWNEIQEQTEISKYKGTLSDDYVVTDPEKQAEIQRNLYSISDLLRLI